MTSRQFRRFCTSFLFNMFRIVVTVIASTLSLSVEGAAVPRLNLEGLSSATFSSTLVSNSASTASTFRSSVTLASTVVTTLGSKWEPSPTPSHLASSTGASATTAPDAANIDEVDIEYGIVSRPGTPIIVLKLDDLYRFEQCIDRFDNVRHLLVKNKIKAGFGVITRSIESIEYYDQYCQWLRTLEGTGFIEIWNHGIDHIRGEFRGDEEDQLEKILYSQSLLQKCGINATTFGAPFNDNNNQTLMALRHVPEMRNLFFPVRDTKIDSSSPVFIYHGHPAPAQRCDMEFSRVGDVNYDYFRKNYERTRYKQPVLVLQGHPNQWDSVHLLEFRRILQYLRSQNTTFMKPSEYLEYAIAQAKALKGAHRVVSTTFEYPVTYIDDTKERDATQVVTLTTTVNTTIAPSMPARFMRVYPTAVPTTNYAARATPTSIPPTPTQASMYQIAPVPPHFQ